MNITFHPNEMQKRGNIWRNEIRSYQRVICKLFNELMCNSSMLLSSDHLIEMRKSTQHFWADRRSYDFLVEIQRKSHTDSLVSRSLCLAF